jgi:hypothetical protein
MPAVATDVTVTGDEMLGKVRRFYRLAFQAPDAPDARMYAAIALGLLDGPGMKAALLAHADTRTLLAACRTAAAKVQR